MAGTKAGAMKAKKTITRLYGRNYYKNLGKLGGASSNTGGFHVNPELARIAGAKGGRVSKRGPARWQS